VGNERYDLPINTKMYRPNNTKSCRNKDPEQVRIHLAGWEWSNYSGIKYGRHYRQSKIANKSCQKKIIISSQMNYMFPPNMVIIGLASRKKRQIDIQLHRG